MQSRFLSREKPYRVVTVISNDGGRRGEEGNNGFSLPPSLFDFEAMAGLGRSSRGEVCFAIGLLVTRTVVVRESREDGLIASHVS